LAWLGGPSARVSTTCLVLAVIVTDDNSAETASGSGRDFGRGYYAFFGMLAGFFVTAVVALTVVVGYSTFQSDSADASPAATPDTTVATEGAVTGDPVFGETIFNTTCIACHGAGAVGVENLGPPLIDNVFIQSLSDDELLVFLNEGRTTDHPDNTTGVAMPPKGGNASLTDEDLNDVIAYLRSLQ